MIAIQKIGKSFMGALNYNLKKLYLPDKRIRGELLASNFMSIDTHVISKEIDMVRSLRPNLNRYAYHTSLNFPNEDQAQLSNDKLLAIALDYLHANGFTNNQYLIFRHHDSNHPHLHILVNRISFDGTVVSDSNNYRKSEKVLRELEHRYNLIAVEQSNFITIEQNNGVTKKLDIIRTKYQDNRGTIERSNNISRRRPTRNEVGMMIRTGKASNKLLLQELILELIQQKPVSIADFIRQGEKFGIYFLFNQATTGRVSGITYFFKDFRSKGQGLGNQFKWAELIGKVNYEQIRDSATIELANSRTRTKYGDFTKSNLPTTAEKSNNGQGIENLYTHSAGCLYDDKERSVTFDEAMTESSAGGEEPLKSDHGVDFWADSSARNTNGGFDNLYSIQISDDVDDESIHGRNRRRKKQARTNTR
jgi:hypothetical protein